MPEKTLQISGLSHRELVELATKLADALQELYDFADVSTHYRWEEKSKAAFDKAAELLKEIRA